MRSGNRLVGTTAKLLIALFAFSCVARSHPWRHQHHQHRLVNPTPATSPAYQFDRELVGDRVTLASNGVEKKLSIRSGNLQRQEIAFTTETDDVGALVAGDIDRDGDVDIVWIGSAQRSAVVLINQGEGNFAEADNAPFLTELDGLFNTGDPSDRRLTKHRRKQASLPSSSFSDISPQPEVDFTIPTTASTYISDLQCVRDQSAFLTRLRGRAPPSLLY